MLCFPSKNALFCPNCFLVVLWKRWHILHMKKYLQKWTMVTCGNHALSHSSIFSCTSWIRSEFANLGGGYHLPPPSERSPFWPSQTGNCRKHTSWKAEIWKSRNLPWANLGMINLLIIWAHMVGFLSFLHSQSWMNSMCRCMPLETSNQNLGTLID